MPIIDNSSGPYEAIKTKIRDLKCYLDEYASVIKLISNKMQTVEVDVKRACSKMESCSKGSLLLSNNIARKIIYHLSSQIFESEICLSEDYVIKSSGINLDDVINAKGKKIGLPKAGSNGLVLKQTSRALVSSSNSDREDEWRSLDNFHIKIPFKATIGRSQDILFTASVAIAPGITTTFGERFLSFYLARNVIINGEVTESDKDLIGDLIGDTISEIFSKINIPYPQLSEFGTGTVYASFWRHSLAMHIAKPRPVKRAQETSIGFKINHDAVIRISKDVLINYLSKEVTQMGFSIESLHLPNEGNEFSIIVFSARQKTIKVGCVSHTISVRFRVKGIGKIESQLNSFEINVDRIEHLDPQIDGLIPGLEHIAEELLGLLIRMYKLKPMHINYYLGDLKAIERVEFSRDHMVISGSLNN